MAKSSGLYGSRQLTSQQQKAGTPFDVSCP